MGTHARVVGTLVLGCLLAAGSAAAEPTAPVTAAATQPLVEPPDLEAIDKPNDDGRTVILRWSKMPFEEGRNVFFEVLMSDTPGGRFWPQGKIASALCPFVSDLPESFGYDRRHRGDKRNDYRYNAACPCPNCARHALEVNRFAREVPVLYADLEKTPKDVLEAMARETHHTVDTKGLANPTVKVERVVDTLSRREYFFKLNVVRGAETVAGTTVVSATPRGEWFGTNKVNVLIAMVLLSVIVLSFVKIAKRDPHRLFIRRISGLEAVEDALGRATEMGKPVFFCHGYGGLSEVVVISAVNLLGKVAERAAEYGTELKVTCMDYLVMQVSQEMVRDAYIRVGRPDAYREENVFYVTGDPFAYAAAIGGMLVRERAGTVFFCGQFSSESLLLSETGAVTKAIQIAGTDNFNQLPFFITTCDYTLIGEEMYAASAYLSREPRLVGTVKGQDVVKAGIMILLLTTTALSTVGLYWFARLFWPL